MSERYEQLGTQPRPGDRVTVMKGPGPGGTVLGTFQRWVVIDQSEVGKVPMLCEPEALLLNQRDGLFVCPPAHWAKPADEVSPLRASDG